MNEEQLSVIVHKSLYEDREKSSFEDCETKEGILCSTESNSPSK